MGKYPADPNAPKRPSTAYFLFLADQRPQIKAANPSFGLAEVGKACGAAWAKLSPAKKQAYSDAAAKQKAKYDVANAKYKATDSYSKWLEGKLEHKKAQKSQEKRNQLKAMLKNKPARPLSGYMRFVAAKRSQFDGSVGEVAAKCGKAWGEASDAEKGRFNRQYEADKAKYDKAMAKYTETDEYKAYEAAFNAHKTEVHKVKFYGSVAAANKAERTRLAARAKKQKERAKAAKDRARKAAIRA